MKNKKWIILYLRKFNFLGRIASFENTKENLQELKKELAKSKMGLIACASDKTENLYLEVVQTGKEV